MRANGLDAELVVCQAQGLGELGADRPPAGADPGLDLAQVLRRRSSAATAGGRGPITVAASMAMSTPAVPAVVGIAVTTLDRGWSKSLTDAAAATDSAPRAPARRSCP